MAKINSAWMRYSLCPQIPTPHTKTYTCDMCNAYTWIAKNFVYLRGVNKHCTLCSRANHWYPSIRVCLILCIYLNILYYHLAMCLKPLKFKKPFNVTMLSFVSRIVPRHLRQ